MAIRNDFRHLNDFRAFAQKLSCLRRESLVQVLGSCFNDAAQRNPRGFTELNKPFLYLSNWLRSDDLPFPEVEASRRKRCCVEAVGASESVDTLGEGRVMFRVRGHEQELSPDGRVSSEVSFEKLMEPDYLVAVYRAMSASERRELFEQTSRDTEHLLEKFIAEERPTMDQVSEYFHHCIDSMEIGLDNERDFHYMSREFNIWPVTDSRPILDDDYSPESEIEERLQELHPGLGANSNLSVFTVEKDMFQTLVFEDEQGMYRCTPWILDLISGSLKKINYEKSLELERKGVMVLFDSCSKLSSFPGEGPIFSRGVDFPENELHFTGIRFTGSRKPEKAYLVRAMAPICEIGECSAYELGSALRSAVKALQEATIHVPKKDEKSRSEVKKNFGIKI